LALPGSGAAAGASGARGSVSVGSAISQNSRGPPPKQTLSPRGPPPKQTLGSPVPPSRAIGVDGAVRMLPLCDSSEACGAHEIASHYLFKLNTVAKLDRNMLPDLIWWRRCKFALVPASPQGAMLSYASEQNSCMYLMHLLPRKFKVSAPKQAVQLARLNGPEARQQLLDEWRQYEAAVLPKVEPTASYGNFPTEVFCIAIHLCSGDAARPVVMAATSWEQRCLWMAMLQTCEPAEILAELPF